MHVSPVEREVDRPECLFELALGTQVKRAGARVGRQRVAAVEIRIVVVAHGLEHGHIDFRKVRTHGNHSRIGVPGTLGVHYIAERHAVARQRLSCNLGVDGRHSLLVEAVGIGLAGASVLIVRLRVCHREKHKCTLHRALLEGKVIAGTGAGVCLIECRAAVGVLFNHRIGRQRHINVPGIGTGGKAELTLRVSYGNAKAIADRNARGRSIVVISNHTLGIGSGTGSIAISIYNVDAGYEVGPHQEIAEIILGKFGCLSPGCNIALDLNGIRGGTERDTGRHIVVSADYHSYAASGRCSANYVAQHLAALGSGEINAAVATDQAAYTKQFNV